MHESFRSHITYLPTSSLGIHYENNPSHYNHNTWPKINHIDHTETYHLHTIAEQNMLKQSFNPLSLVLASAHTSFLFTGNYLEIMQNQLALLVAQL